MGLKISGGRDSPVVPGDPGIFITTVKRGSLLHKVLGSGDKILKVLTIEHAHNTQSKAWSESSVVSIDNFS